MKEGQPESIHLSDYQPPPFLIEETRLHVDIRDGFTEVTATLLVRRNPAATEGQKDLVLDGGKGLETQHIALDDRELLSNEYTIDDESLTVFDVPDSFALETSVKIRPEQNTTLEGLYRSGGMYCTQCEAEGFRHITWYADRPDVMSKFRTTIVADRASCPVLLSNGNAVERGEEGSRHWVSWEDPFRKPAYLFALVAGDLEHVEDTFTTMNGREVSLQIYTEAHNIDKVGHAMSSLKKAMAWDEQVYGREYDLDIFMIVAVESFNMGAMENKGLNIFNTSCVLARPDTTTDAGYQRVESVVAHEYFHNWSGNRVTCRDWFQLSLKEGFTVFRDQQFSADMGSPAVCRVEDVALLRVAQFPEDAGPMAHPVRPDSYIEINNFYTATVYEKGAEVVRMMATLVGEENFRRGTDLYFDRHDGEAVTTEDFVRAIEEASGVDLEQFRVWYRQAGTPVLKVTSQYDADTRRYTLCVDQHCPPTPGQETKEPYHMPFAVGLVDSRGRDMVLSAESVRGPVREPDPSTEDSGKEPVLASTISDESRFTMVLNLRKEVQEFVFEDVAEKPVPSLLRNFSAPVQLEYDYTRDELMFLMSHDSDGFNRWEAGQRLAVDVIQEVIAQLHAGEEVHVDQRLVQACEANLNQAVEHDRDGRVDKAMLANMLVMPSEAYLGEVAASSGHTIDVDAIFRAREIVIGEIAARLQGLLLTVFKLNRSGDPWTPDAGAVAMRALKNVALGYLMKTGDRACTDLCVRQFSEADNMTDTSAALRAMVNVEGAEEEKERMLVDFYNRWADEALVVDLWFSIQAACPRPGGLARVQALTEHPAFNLENPNRMRSVISAFATGNIVNFHDRSGGGYRFLADHIIRLDAINPQMAARMLAPLTRWRRYDEDRQSMMKSEISRILDSGSLSENVYEIASKSVSDRVEG